MLLSTALKPLTSTSRSTVLQSVRHNCPWHRSNYRPAFFPFNLRDKLRFRSVEALSKKQGGRELIMRRVLREQAFLGWQYDHKPSVKKHNYPM